MNAPGLPATAAPPPLDLARLRAWLAPQLRGLDAGPLAAERLAGGQSNPTWRLSAGPHAWILRAKPGPVASLLPSAHAIEREARVLRALQGSEVPVPAVQLLCEDESVIGAAFYVMDFVDGRILRDTALPDASPGERAALYDEAGRVIAALHRVDWRARGLADHGRAEGHVQRMVARWTRQYRATQTTPLEAMERLIDWLPRHLPPLAQAPEAALLHGDFRLENLIFHAEEPRVLAVLDWELSTLGHPLVDLAYHCTAWHLPPGPLRGHAGADLAALGIPSETETIARYCRRTGRDDLDAVLAQWPYFLACNLFRIAAILQGIARRVLDGTAAHPQAREIARQAGPVAELGWRIAQADSPQHPIAVLDA